MEKNIRIRTTEEIFEMLEKLCKWHNLSKTTMIENLIIWESRRLYNKENKKMYE